MTPSQRQRQKQSSNSKRYSLESIEKFRKAALESWRQYHDRNEIRPNGAGWNKGIPAWNKDRPWRPEVRQRISQGMQIHWLKRKEKEREEAK